MHGNDSCDESRTVSPTPAEKTGRLTHSEETILLVADRSWTAQESEEALETIQGLFEEMRGTVEAHSLYAVADTMEEVNQHANCTRKRLWPPPRRRSAPSTALLG